MPRTSSLEIYGGLNDFFELIPHSEIIYKVEEKICKLKREEDIIDRGEHRVGHWGTNSRSLILPPKTIEEWNDCREKCS